MSNDNLNRITDQQTITSMEIAEITGKNHSDVLRAVREMESAWEKVKKKRKFAFLQIYMRLIEQAYHIILKETLDNIQNRQNNEQQ